MLFCSFRIVTSNLCSKDIEIVAKLLKSICRDKKPILLENHFKLVTKLDLNGVHLTDEQKSVSSARKYLGKQHIIGAFCELSKHAALIAAENGANYISLSTKGKKLDSAERASELFEWWAKFIETPLMGESDEHGNIPKQILIHCDLISSNEFLSNSL